MAVATTMSGSLALSLLAQAAYGTDWGGTATAKVTDTVSFAASGGTDPTIAGFLKGTGSISGAVDMLLAHATDPLQGAGDATYSTGYAPSGVGKIKAIYLQNTTAAGGGNLTVARGAANGAPIFDTAGDSITLPPGGIALLYFKTGTAVITTGSSDKVTVTPSTGTVTFTILVVYGT